MQVRGKGKEEKVGGIIDQQQDKDVALKFSVSGTKDPTGIVISIFFLIIYCPFIELSVDDNSKRPFNSFRKTSLNHQPFTELICFQNIDLLLRRTPSNFYMHDFELFNYSKPKSFPAKKET